MPPVAIPPPRHQSVDGAGKMRPDDTDGARARAFADSRGTRNVRSQNLGGGATSRGKESARPPRPICSGVGHREDDGDGGDEDLLHEREFLNRHAKCPFGTLASPVKPGS